MLRNVNKHFWHNCREIVVVSFFEPRLPSYLKKIIAFVFTYLYLEPRYPVHPLSFFFSLSLSLPWLPSKGYCWHHFFDTCQGRWFLWREGGQFGRNQKMHRVGIGRWSPSDGPGEYTVKMLICPFWCSADGELPMRSRKKKRTRTLRESWRFGCNI